MQIIGLFKTKYLFLLIFQTICRNVTSILSTSTVFQSGV
uniref:Uncharacterized protein n=1 Tax=Anguilla anguilla TaxID=7936 RepID=A0A0E9UHA4_ANGAN